jgi:hypothetical protein
VSAPPLSMNLSMSARPGESVVSLANQRLSLSFSIV